MFRVIINFDIRLPYFVMGFCCDDAVVVGEDYLLQENGKWYEGCDGRVNAVFWRYGGVLTTYAVCFTLFATDILVI